MNGPVHTGTRMSASNVKQIWNKMHHIMVAVWNISIIKMLIISICHLSIKHHHIIAFTQYHRSIHLPQLIPGVGHVSLSSLTLLQPELGENPDQHHDGHHSTDNIHDHVGPIPVWFLVDLRDRCGRLSCVCPHGCVVVGTGSLVQTVDFELAAEAVEAGTTTEQVDASVTVEGRVPLAHDIIVTPATVAGNWNHFVLRLWRRRCQRGLRHHSGLHCLVGNLGQSLTRSPRAQSTQRGQTQENSQRDAHQERMNGGGHLGLIPMSCDGSVLMCISQW